MSHLPKFSPPCDSLGCNVICLRLWKGHHREGPYFTALYSFFNVGNIIGPILAGAVLHDGDAADDGDSSSAAVPTPLQTLHLLVGAALFVLSAACFVAFLASAAHRKRRRRKREKKRKREAAYAVAVAVEEQDGEKAKVRLAAIDDDERKDGIRC